MKDKVINDLLSRISDLEFEVEKKDRIINELENKIYYLYNYAGLNTSSLKEELQELKGSDK